MAGAAADAVSELPWRGSSSGVGGRHQLPGKIPPLLAALTIVPQGQGSAAWLSLFALRDDVVLSLVGRWSSHYVANFRKRMKAHAGNGLTYFWSRG